MITKKQLIIALCILVQSNMFALQTVSNAVADWDARIAQARELTTQMKMSSGKQKKQRQTDLADYCNSKFGFHGRMLNQYLNDDQKHQVYMFCGDAMKDKNPKAYEAVSGKSAQTKTTSKATVKQKSEQLKDTAQDYNKNATALKERAKADAEKPWYKW